MTTVEGAVLSRIDSTRRVGGGRTLDCVCPFRNDNFFCPHVLSPPKLAATPKEAKLLLVLGKAASGTKVGCTRCEVFREVWTREMTVMTRLRFLWIKFRQGGRSLSSSVPARW